MAENLNLGLTVEAWANIVIERWETKLQRLNIRHTGKLADSFHQHVVTQANGNPQLIVFTFEYYGKFVDMGVGRGVTIEQVASSNRRPKAWYSKVFFSQLEKLKEILAEKYAIKGQMEIITNVERFNEEGGHLSRSKSSGTSRSSSVDSVTGRKKITYQEFLERRKQSGW